MDRRTHPLDVGTATTLAAERTINNKVFARRLAKLKAAREFLWVEGIPLPQTAADEYLLGPMEAYAFDRKGREPTGDEWRKLEILTYRFSSLLTDDQRLRFKPWGFPTSVLWLTVAVMLLAFGSLTGAAHPEALAAIEYFFTGLRPHLDSIQLLDAAIWCICLGVLGAAAHLGFNVLSIQRDATFDLTNSKLVVLRLLLGALFGLVIALPLSWQGFLQVASLLGGDERTRATLAASTPIDSSERLRSIASMLLPFLLGFSTTLIITIMSRFTMALGTLFGIALDQSPKPGSSLGEINPLLVEAAKK